MASNKRQGSNSSHGHDEGTERKKSRKENDDGMFDYNSDDELPEESIKARLSWRNDDDPFADWKIVISVAVTTNTPPQNATSTNQEDTGKNNKEYIFNVRKCVLADGPRRSEYFVRLFENDGNFSEAQDKTSRIELSQLQAEAFPVLLDYMYSTGQKFPFTTNTATALYTLSKYFGVRRLENEAKQFCLQDMQHVDKCGTYFEHATILQVENILEAASQFCRDNIKQMNYNTSRLSRVFAPQFWLDLMKDHAEKNTIASLGYALGLQIAVFCRNHATVLSLEMFKQLTDEKYLLERFIHPNAAVVLLNNERFIVEKTAQQQELQQGSELSSLQIRCVKAIGHWPDKVDFSRPGFRDRLTKLSASVLYEILATREHHRP